MPMDNERIRERLKASPKLKKLMTWFIMNQVETRP